jgi:hypothetical protein
VGTPVASALQLMVAARVRPITAPADSVPRNGLLASGRQQGVAAAAALATWRSVRHVHSSCKLHMQMLMAMQSSCSSCKSKGRRLAGQLELGPGWR